MSKLTQGEIHLLKLIRKGSGTNGWTSVSEPVSTVVSPLPKELVEFEKLEIGGRARLTAEGNSVLDAMEWL